MQNQRKNKISYDNLHPEDKARAAASFWDLLWMMETLELCDADEIGEYDVPEYISEHGTPDAELR